MVDAHLSLHWYANSIDLLACQQAVSMKIMTSETGPGGTRTPHVGVSVAEAPLSSLLLQVVRAHAALATAMLQQIDLVGPQELVLLYLQEHGRTAQSEIVHFLGRDRSTVTNTLQAMQRAALISRAPSQTDKRTMIVALSDKGRRLCPRIREIWSELERLTFGGLSARQRADLAQTLVCVRQELRASRSPIEGHPADLTPPTSQTPGDQNEAGR
jgi:DNA-binding MarR family transcriptional regulator